jgi:hypothetical protein
MALGTGLRLAEIVGLDVADAYVPDSLDLEIQLALRANLRAGER